MYELALDDVTQARNKKYGFNNTVAVLKGADSKTISVVLILHVELRYFKNGRANMHTKRSYSVETLEHGRTINCARFTVKSEATKHFNSLTKQLTKE